MFHTTCLHQVGQHLESNPLYWQENEATQGFEKVREGGKLEGQENEATQGFEKVREGGQEEGERKGGERGCAEL